MSARDNKVIDLLTLNDELLREFRETARKRILAHLKHDRRAVLAKLEGDADNPALRSMGRVESLSSALEYASESWTPLANTLADDHRVIRTQIAEKRDVIRESLEDEDLWPDRHRIVGAIRGLETALEELQNAYDDVTDEENEEGEEV